MQEVQVGIISKNSKKIIDFYVKTFGFTVLFEDTSGYAELQTEIGVKLVIEPDKMIQEELNKKLSFRQFVRIEVVGMESVISQCQKQEGKLLRPPIAQPYGKIEAYIMDPEDNVIQLFEKL